MRLTIITAALLVASYPAYGQRNARNETEAVERACTVEDCFLEGQVRDFEVIDRTHVIVYVGAQRCAFHVELRGALCDLSFAPELYFRRANEVPMIYTSRPDNGIDTPNAVTPRTGNRSSDFDQFELQQRERRDLRVCKNDLTIQVHGGRWTETQSNAGTDRFGNPNSDCRISNVTSITDDQLLEFYVGRGVVAPVPPMGTGQIEVGEQEERADKEAASPAPSRAEPGQRGRRKAE
ncbi:MAG TPA: hypothetical protein VM692_07295 [Gammaproteobacteria bacterium]|nr:hypothetical protein [Gammaproteobacteria bacterium]